MKKYRVEFGELRLGETAKNNLINVWETSWASAGPKVAELEKKWCELFGYKHTKSMSSGTDADINACAALYDFGAKRGDEVIVPALAFIAAANSVLAAGLKPVFVDVEKDTLNINPCKIEEKITPNTRAIMAVSTMGKPPEMDTIRQLAKTYNLKVILDNCEGHGCKYKGQFAGKLADMSTYSMYIAHLVTAGEGGAVGTDCDEIASVLGSTRSHGRLEGSLYFDHLRVGFNSKMNDLEASLALEGVENFHETFNIRHANVEYLRNGCKDLEEYAWFNKEESYEICCPHAFSVTLKDPRFNYQKFYDFMDERGVKVKRNFGCIPTQHKAYDFMGHKYGEFPEAEYIGNNGLHFGVHQYLTKDDLDYALEVLHDYFKTV
jgi:dTDP-4-amino-4,6-dideoxygalactose transaminase